MSTKSKTQSSKGMSNRVTILKDKDQRKKFVYGNDKCIIFYSAVWCPKCEGLVKMYSKLADKYGDAMKFGHCDIDEANIDYEAIPRFDCFYKGKRARKFISSNQGNVSEAIWDFLTYKK